MGNLAQWAIVSWVTILEGGTTHENEEWVLTVLAMVVAAAAGVRAGWGDTTVNFGIKWQDYGGTMHPLRI